MGRKPTSSGLCWESFGTSAIISFSSAIFFFFFFISRPQVQTTFFTGYLTGARDKTTQSVFNGFRLRFKTCSRA
ncbi:hypothetical protein OROHE_018651 [Orobanche hederae]